LALLQAEEIACALELVNVPNVRCSGALCMKPLGSLRPLRTVLASFPAYGSSNLKAITAK